MYSVEPLAARQKREMAFQKNKKETPIGGPANRCTAKVLYTQTQTVARLQGAEINFSAVFIYVRWVDGNHRGPLLVKSTNTIAANFLFVFLFSERSCQTFTIGKCNKGVVHLSAVAVADRQ